jgi:hypothetical protein
MNISFEIDGVGLVMLPETHHVVFEPEEARKLIKSDRKVRRSYLYPLLDATAHFACSLLIAPQGCEPFDLPREPWIIIIGDDLHFAWGPKAFDAKLLDAAIKSAGQFVIISSGPEPFAYRVAATAAVRDRRNALLIETQPHQQEAWRSRIEEIRGADAPIFFCVPHPTEAAT